MRHNTKKGRTPFKSKRYGKTRRVQRGGALIPVMEKGQQVGEYDDKTRLGRAVYPGVGVYEGHFNENGVPHGGGTLTYEDGAVYKGEWVNDMPRGHGVMTFANGNVYDGGWVDNEMSGRGVMTFPSGRVYDGEWSNSACNGHGKMTYADESVYEGNWLDNLKHGEGTQTHIDGTIYAGNWDADQMNGHGIYTFAPGELERVYEGNTLNGMFNGHGIMRYTNGDVYEGQWANDKKNGHGTMEYASDERVYEGNWLDDERHGQGKLTYPDGEKYEGAWDNNQLNGQGKMTYANGDVYVGNWRNNERHGQGIMRYANGDVYVGDWLNDDMHGQGTYTCADGTVYDGNFINNDMHGQGVYEGEFEDGLANGHGKCRFINGNVYEGGWSADYCHGQGRMTYANGDVYVGPWHYNKRHMLRDGEEGKMTYADGRVYEGEWWKDNMHGKGKMTGPDGSTIYDGLWRNNRQNPHFFDTETGKLADNDDYNPPDPAVMYFPNSDNMLYSTDKYKRQYKFNDVIFNEEKNVSDELKNDPTMIALKLNWTYYVLSKENIIGMMNDKQFIRYECGKTDHDDDFSIDADVNKTVPYLGLNGITSHQGGVVLLSDLWAAIKSGHNAYEFVKTGRTLLTVASHHVAYDYGLWMAAVHCQHDKGADIYELQKLRIAERPRPRQKTRRVSHRSHPYLGK